MKNGSAEKREDRVYKNMEENVKKQRRTYYSVFANIVSTGMEKHIFHTSMNFRTGYHL